MTMFDRIDVQNYGIFWASQPIPMIIIKHNDTCNMQNTYIFIAINNIKLQIHKQNKALIFYEKIFQVTAYARAIFHQTIGIQARYQPPKPSYEVTTAKEASHKPLAHST